MKGEMKKEKNKTDEQHGEGNEPGEKDKREEIRRKRKKAKTMKKWEGI